MERFSKISYQSRILWCKVIEDNYYELDCSIYDDNPRIKEQQLNLSDIRHRPPCDGHKVIGLAYNYKGLVGKRESYPEPLFFFKSPTGLIGNSESVIYPCFAQKVWHEVELAIIIKSKGKNISISDADKYILGYTCGNDITCENILNRDWHLARSKGLDTFCPLGPFLVKNVNTNNLRLRSYINEKITQESYTSDRILNDREIVSLISRYVTLFPGDVILTGTPAGATEAIISPGDSIKVEIEDIGSLINYVRRDKEEKQ